VTGPKVVTGADVPETDIEVMNPEIHLFTLESGRGNTTSSVSGAHVRKSSPPLSSALRAYRRRNA